MKLALSMITGGDENPQSLMNCLNTVAKWVDGIFIVITAEDKENKIADVCKRYGVNYEYLPDKFHRVITDKEVEWLKKYFGYEPQLKAGDKVFEFDKARNYSMGMIPKEYDWMLWLDVDDVLREGQNLKDIIKWGESLKPAIESVFFNYLYQVEIAPDGRILHVLIEHLRERLVKIGRFRWVAPIHETLIEIAQTNKIDVKEWYKQTKIVPPDVVHLTSGERMMGALQRNLRALEMSIYDTKGKDPRPNYYLGKAYFDLHTEDNFKKAEVLFNKYLGIDGNPDQSGWPEERAQCWEYLGEIYRGRGQHAESIKCFHNALMDSEVFPSTYLNIALSYLLMGKYDRALNWVIKSGKMPQPQSTLVNNPKDTIGRFLEITYLSNINLNRLDEAWASAVKLADMFPDNPEMQNRLKFTSDLKQQRELTQIIMKMAKFLKETGQKDKLQPLVQALPVQISNNPFMAELYKEAFPPRTWGDKEVAIFCGPGFTQWSPKTITNPGGNFAGGSEEAVVYLSQELSKLGWKVTVFADPGPDEGEHEGVIYLPFYKFNNQDQFNVLVGWRNIKFFDGDYSAKKKYVWCHDILNPVDHTKERLEKIDKIIVLSPWHRQTIPDVPDEKIMVSSNGVAL